MDVKNKIKIRRIVTLMIFLGYTVVFLVVLFSACDFIGIIGTPFLIIPEILTIIAFALSMSCNCKIYNYKGKELLIYSGPIDAYFRLDGVRLAITKTKMGVGKVHNTLLSVTLDDGTYLESMLDVNKKIVGLKINGVHATHVA